MRILLIGSEVLPSSGINRPTKGTAKFLQNGIYRYLSRLLMFLSEKKTPLTEPPHAIDQGIKIAEMCYRTWKHARSMLQGATISAEIIPDR